MTRKLLAAVGPLANVARTPLIFLDWSSVPLATRASSDDTDLSVC